MIEIRGAWTFSFRLNQNDRVSTELIGGGFEDASEGEIDTFLIEGAYEIIRQSEQFAAKLARKDKC